MHESTRSNVRKVGRPSAATRRAPNAKGRAKTVCEKRISRRTRVMTFGRGSVLSSTAMSPKRLADRREKLLYARTRAGENRCPVCEKHAIKSVIEKFPQRPAHQPRVQTIFCRQQAESVGLEV